MKAHDLGDILTPETLLALKEQAKASALAICCAECGEPGVYADPHVKIRIRFEGGQAGASEYVHGRCASQSENI